jgi:hypothetical protein
VVALVAAALLASPIYATLGARADGSAGSDPTTRAVVRNGNLAASLGLSGTLEQVLISGTYSPTLRLTDRSGAGAGLFQALQLSGSGRSGRLTLTGSAGGTIGQQDFSPLAESPVSAPGAALLPPINRLPRTRFVSVGSASGQLGAGYFFSSRLEAGMSAGIATTGGLDAGAQAVLPRQRSATLATTGRWQVDRLDALSGSIVSSVASTGQPRTAGQERTFTIGGQLAWARRFSPTTSGTLGVGAAFIHSTGRGLNQNSALPTVSVSLAHTVPLRAQSLSMSLTAAIQPLIDPLTGAGYFQATAAGAVTYSPNSWLSLTGAGSGARAIRGPFSGQWGAVGEASAGVRLSRRTTFSVGFREARVLTAAAAPTAGSLSQNPLQWTAFAGISTALQEAL